RLVEQGGGDVVGDVAHHLEMRSAECGMRNARVSVDESMPVQLQGVPQHEAESANSELRTPHSALVCQLSIFFYRNHPQPAGEQLLSKAPSPRSDLEHDIAGRGVERVDDALQDVPIGEKVLAEPLVRLHSLRRTTVRSSVGAAPPVKPARSACTDSRISRAGRPFSRATCP